MIHYLENGLKIELGDRIGLYYGDDIASALRPYNGPRATILDLGLVGSGTNLRQTILVCDLENQHWLDMVDGNIPRVLLINDVPRLRVLFNEQFQKIK